MSGAVYPSLRERVVFVTGGATGIGAALVRAFHGQGARVGFIDLLAGAGQALRESLGEGVWFGECDATDPAALEAAITAAAAGLGPITVLVNNVANDTRQSIEALDPPTWRANLAVNLDPVFFAARQIALMMRQAGGGSIINLGSITARLGNPDLPAYVAAKGAIEALTRSLARAWGPFSIRVNTIEPGWVVTERQLALWLTPEAEAEWARHVALPGRLRPEDIARSALFLASDESAMITGQTLAVNAGRL